MNTHYYFCNGINEVTHVISRILRDNPALEVREMPNMSKRYKMYNACIIVGCQAVEDVYHSVIYYNSKLINNGKETETTRDNDSTLF